jgi:LuxR family transcriptional regulator, maltose regulon positive regulatory protein
MVTLWRQPTYCDPAATLPETTHRSTSAELYATLLGPFTLSRNGRRVPIGRRGAVAELSRYLVAHAGRLVPRDELIELLWPSADVQRAVHRLHVAISNLRSTLGAGASPLRLEDDKYVIVADSIRTDCDTFDAHYGEAKAAAARRAYAAAAESFRSALATYGGEYVADRPYADWTAQPRARFAERRLGALTWLCEHALREGDVMLLAEYAGEILETDNLRERIHRHLMRAHYALGERGLAIRQYQRCAVLLESELGALPSRETQQLYEAIVSDVPLPDERYPLDRAWGWGT